MEDKAKDLLKEISNLIKKRWKLDDELKKVNEEILNKKAELQKEIDTIS